MATTTGRPLLSTDDPEPMVRTVSYSPYELLPYVNWLYFFHAWGLPPRFSSIAGVHGCVACRKSWVARFEAGERGQAEAAVELYEDACRQLAEWETEHKVHARFGIFEAWSEDDDIMLRRSSQPALRFPFLRQQRPSRPGEPHLCWADFIAPQGVEGTHEVGFFATSVEQEMENQHGEDDYRHMLVQTLCDRLAEAAAEKMHEDVRKRFWGYAPEESLTSLELFEEKYQGRRPAVGYPSLPDLSVIFLVDELIGLSRIGISLTENGMMRPHAAVCGLMFSHPACRHFSIGAIDGGQLEDYAARRKMPVAAARKFLAANLARK